MSREARPPRGAGRWAEWRLDPDQAARLLDALDEEYVEHQRTARGRLGADVWYWRQVIGSVWVLRRSARGRSRVDGRRGGDGMGAWVRDFRFAARQLMRARTFTLAAAASLAIGIGATTAIFSVVQSVLLRSLPYEEPERIARAWAHADDGSITDFTFRVAEYRELRNRTDVFEAVGAEFPLSVTVLVPEQEPQQVSGRMVSSDFFRVFGVEPALGRMFGDREILAGDRLAAVVTHGFWSRYLGSDPGAVGRSVDLNGNPFEVVAVLPEGYTHVSGTDAQLFIPYTIGTSRWVAHWLDLYVRLQPDVTLERAREQITATLRQVGETESRSAGWHATTESLHEMVVGDIRTAVWAVFGMVGLVLLVACVNVANLVLARSATRSTEMAVRRALGAGRSRLTRQLAAESLLLAALGGGLGLALAAGTLKVLLALAPASIPRIADTVIDPGVLLFSAAVTLLTAIGFGLLPALRATGPRAGTGDRSRTGDRGLGRILNGLVVVEVALAMTLLVGAGLMVRSLQGLDREDLGFDRQSTLTFRVQIPGARYPTAEDTDAFYTRLRTALAGLPGVTAVGAGSDLPLSGQGAVATVNSEERVQRGIEEGATVLQRRASEGFFAALGTDPIEGRAFDSSDRPDGERVTVISASLADLLFADGRAVGRRVGWGSTPDEEDWMTVVGVVPDVRFEGVEAAPDPQLYQAHPQSAIRDMAVLVRTSGDPTELVEPVRRVLGDLDSTVPMYDVSSLGGLVDTALSARTFTMTLFSLFAGAALLLMVAGLYGVLAFAVNQRRREIGVRMALGAGAAEVARLVLRRGGVLIGLGLLTGVGGAMAAGRLLEGLLFGVGAVDAGTYAAVAAILATVGVAACLLPARGATRVDPMTTLREE